MALRVQIIGHRGSPATHPENTIAGFRHAMASGADGVELDVAVTLDDKLVVTHDLLLASDGRVVRDCLASDLLLPALDQALALESPPQFCFDVEAKAVAGLTPEPVRYAQLLNAAVSRSRDPRRVLVRSFEHDVLRAVHQLRPDIVLAALIEFSSDEWVEIAQSAQASVISPRGSTVTRDRVTRAHAAGISVSAWTVNDPADWQRLAAMGVDSIITDDPARMVRWRASAIIPGGSPE